MKVFLRNDLRPQGLKEESQFKLQLHWEVHFLVFCLFWTRKGKHIPGFM